LAAAEPERALRAYDHALALDPGYTPALARRLALLRSLGRWAEADAQAAANQRALAGGAWTLGD
jgi:hypothetical protein